MTLNSQPFPKSVSIRVNPCLRTLSPDSWLTHSQWPGLRHCPSRLPCPNFLYVLPIEIFSPCSMSSVAATQYAQNKANSPNPKIPTTAVRTKIYVNSLSVHPPENKPNFPKGSPAGQTQSRPQPREIRRQGPKGASRDTRPVPPRYAIRDTRYEPKTLYSLEPNILRHYLAGFWYNVIMPLERRIQQLACSFCRSTGQI